MVKQGCKLGAYCRNNEIPEARFRKLVLKAEEPYRSLFCFLYLAGSRISECLNLTKKDFSIDQEFLKVELRRLKRGDNLVSPVWLPLMSPFCRVITAYLKKCRSEILWNLSRTDVWRYLKKLDDGLTLHDFRRNRAFHFIRQEASPWAVQSWFGWKSPSTVTSYVEIAGTLSKPLGSLLSEAKKGRILSPQ